jgi:hypothetical protein
MKSTLYLYHQQEMAIGSLVCFSIIEVDENREQETKNHFMINILRSGGNFWVNSLIG